MSILKEADALINGPRAESYGDAKVEFNKVAFEWATYIWNKYHTHVPLEAEDICWMMADLKKIRQMVTKKLDNPRDAAGYIGLVEKVSDIPKRVATDGLTDAPVEPKKTGTVRDLADRNIPQPPKHAYCSNGNCPICYG